MIRRRHNPLKTTSNDKVKVLHVTCSFDIGGTQRQIMNLCENNDGGYFAHEAIEIFPEQNYLYRKGVSLDKDRYTRGNIFARKLGSCISFRTIRALQLFQIYKLVCDFKAIRPEVVIGWGHEIAMVSFIAASIARVPKIVFCIRTFNPSYGWTTIGPLIKKAHGKMVPFLSKIIVNSTALQDDYSNWLNIPTEKIDVCPNGIDPSILTSDEHTRRRKHIRSFYNIPDDAIVITNIGRFSKEKGQMLMVQAYRELVKRFPMNKIYCLFCGDGSTQPEVRAYADNYRLDKVLLAGCVYNIHPYLCASDIFVMPSDFEGMPNAMMEAMAYGLPSVSTDNTGALDVARDNLEALYADVGSAEQLAEKLSYLIERQDERERIGANAQKRLKEFSVSNMISTFNGYLETVTEKGAIYEPGFVKKN